MWHAGADVNDTFESITLPTPEIGNLEELAKVCTQ
jgi:hypothetical protein